MPKARRGEKTPAKASPKFFLPDFVVCFTDGRAKY